MGGDGAEEVGGWGGPSARVSCGRRGGVAARHARVGIMSHFAPSRARCSKVTHTARRSMRLSVAAFTWRRGRWRVRSPIAPGGRLMDRGLQQRVDAWMNETGHPVPMMGTPTDAESQRAMEDSRRLFHRTLACWVCDVLALKRAGLDRPRWRPGIAESEWTLAA